MTQPNVIVPIIPAGHRLLTPASVALVAGVVFSGAIFGFFYAWVCSTMWGLDNADPRVAIAAMQAMNESVRNPVFFPAFFLTPAVLALASGLAFWEGRRRSAVLAGAAGLVYLLGGLVLTTTLNVPLNDALGASSIPTELAAAEAMWRHYSSTWQGYNQIRTVVSGIALTLGAAALLTFYRRRGQAVPIAAP